MGNQKYPLNGKALTLEDLVSEYAFNAEIRYNDDYIENKEHTTMISELLTDLCVNTSLYNLYEQNVDGNTFNDLSTYRLDKSNTSLFDSSKLLTLYNSFDTNIISEDNKDKADKTYELCYFPTVYSKEKRTSDNKKYKIIQAGDDELFAPDKYIKFKDIITVGNAMRPIQLFHYTYDNLAFDVNKSEYDNRYSFNYKRNDGEAVISYAIRQLYALDSSDNSSLLGLSKKLNCIDFDTFEKNEITSTTNVNDISISSINLTQFKNSSLYNLHDLFDFILFGKYTDNDTSTSIDKFYIFFAPGEDRDNPEITVPETLYYPLLYDLRNQYNNIITGNNELSIFAYKYLCNAEYRNTDARYVISQDNKCDIIFKKINKDNKDNNNTNIEGSFNEFLKKYIFDSNIFDSSFILDHEDAFNNSYYDVYDEVTNQVKELDIYKKYNLYWKILYYCQLIAGSQLYYTGIILDAVYDVINEQHLYTNESPIYRCDIGANSNIQTVWVRNIVECLYGLPPTNLEEYNAIININIPITIKTLISETNTIYNKRWNMQQIKTLLQSGLNANTEYDVNTGVIEPDPNIPYEYMVVYDVNNKPLDIKTLDDINNMLSATMSTYVMDIKNKDPRVSELNQTLTIWDSKTNPSYNTTNGQFNNYGDNPLTFLRGTIFAHINYSGDHFINIEFPVMRLQNYYTESVINQKRVVNLYFVKPISVSDIEDEHTYNVNISYNFTDNSDTLKSSILINNLNDVNVWLYSYSGSATLYKFMSGTEVLNAHNENSNAYTRTLKVNDTSIYVESDIELYNIKIDNNVLEKKSLNIVFNESEDENIKLTSTFNIQLRDSVKGNYTITIYNKCNEHISLLYKCTASVTGTNFDNTRTLYWTGKIATSADAVISNITPGELYLYSYKNELVLSKNNENNKNTFTFINNFGKIITNDDSFSCDGKPGLQVYIFNKKLYTYSIINKTDDDIYINDIENIGIPVNNVVITEKNYKELNKSIMNYLEFNDKNKEYTITISQDNIITISNKS